MARTRTRIIVELDLDPVPGWGHIPADHVQLVWDALHTQVPHYNPTVELDASVTAIRLMQAEGREAIEISDRWECEAASKQANGQPWGIKSVDNCHYYRGDVMHDHCLHCGQPEERK